MHIRPACIGDFKQLYELGARTPELRVSATEPFMDHDDFGERITDSNHVFLVAEKDSQITGFICANGNDADRPLKNKYACIVYLAVDPIFRRQGIAEKLYDACALQLKEKGITHMYGLVKNESKPIQAFFRKKGFAEGHRLIWMDKPI